MPSIVQQRLIRRQIIEIIAAPLEGAAKEAFLADAEAALNRQLPLPNRTQRRASFHIVR
ncbi:hypothetical protein ACQKOE_07365 [Novosphingobium sp. NPDC080210]|uniref:hypothetical protein n=1 Tax=Novosphingobium sp. NPDC080210 TaxID=3390596 RepID=UPI003CFE95AF